LIRAGWEAVAKLAAIAAIRTFLSNFLDRDLAEVRERAREADTAPQCEAHP